MLISEFWPLTYNLWPIHDIWPLTPTTAFWPIHDLWPRPVTFTPDPWPLTSTCNIWALTPPNNELGLRPLPFDPIRDPWHWQQPLTLTCDLWPCFWPQPLTLIHDLWCYRHPLTWSVAFDVWPLTFDLIPDPDPDHNCCSIKKLPQLILCNLSTQRLRSKGAVWSQRRNWVKPSSSRKAVLCPRDRKNQSLGFSMLEHISFLFNTLGKGEDDIKTYTSKWPSKETYSASRSRFLVALLALAQGYIHAMWKRIQNTEYFHMYVSKKTSCGWP